MTDTDVTTLVSLFHTPELAHEAIADLEKAGIPASSIQKLGQATTASTTSLQELGLPPEDLRMLSSGINDGGTVLLVSGTGKLVKEAESIFKKHHAHKVDEQILHDDAKGFADTGLAEGDITIPIVEEAMVVGKRAVQTGGVRVVSRITETPVEEQITLHEEHAVVERRPVNRAVTEADLRMQSFEVLNTDEEAIVSKTAKVVEEVVVGKDAGTRTETVTGTVRKTEVEVDRIASKGQVHGN